MKWLIGLFVALLTVTASAALPPTGTQFHAVSLRVLVDDQVIMTPSMHLLAGKPASISLKDDASGKTYRLKVNVTDGVKAPGTDKVGVGLEVSLTADGATRPIFDSALILDPARTGAVSSLMTGPKGKTGVEVTTHEVKTLTAADTEKAKAADKTCQNGGCCGGPCTDQGGSYQCCNVIWCCICGSCCQVP